MSINNLRLMVTLLIATTIIVAPQLTPSQAQTGITVQCGEDYTQDPNRLPVPFPGAYYHTAQIGITELGNNWIFERITDQGRSQMTISLPNQSVDMPLAPLISPNGSKIVFRPNTGDHLTVWNVSTNEVATFALERSIAEYLNAFDRNNREYLNKLIWDDNNTLVIQYQDYRGLTIPEAQLRITVQENPLRLTALNAQMARMTNLIYQGDFSIEVGEQVLSLEGSDDIGFRMTEQTDLTTPRQTYRIYDTTTNMLVWELPSVSENNLLVNTPPQWLSTLDYFFYLDLSIPNGTNLVEIDVTNNFARNDYLDQQLMATFGTASTISQLYVSNDGLSIGFSLRSEPGDQYYEVKYTPATREIVAVCRNARIDGDGFPFFAPGDEHIVYFDGGVIVFDLATGNSYRLPNRGYVGWISAP
jgi:hypothetical protein